MRSEPVVSAQAIAAAVQAAVMALVAMAASLEWIVIDPQQMGAVEKTLAAFGALAVLVVPQIAAAFYARNQVTPVRDPRTATGEPAVIVPLAQAQQMGLAPWDGNE